MGLNHPPDPCAVVIFGASGDLTGRKLLPALHNLQVEEHVSPDVSVIGMSRTEMSDEAFAEDVRADVQEHSRIKPTDGSWDRLATRIHYVTGDVTDEDAFLRLKSRLDEIDEREGTKGNRIWYMASLPKLFPVISEGIRKSGLLDTGGWHRLVVEKPFANDLESARDLNGVLSLAFSEDQIFRIDHYLGKETVQNLLVFRFANAIFEPIWNRRYVDHVQITVAEDIGIEGRGAFYEQTGALRDVAQNHLLQLMTLIAMEPPIAWDATAIRDEKVQVLRAARRWTTEECAQMAVLGQYEGYRGEEKVADDSTVETFVAMKLLIDNWRWADVPFYLRTGKKLPAKTTEIAVQFKRVPHLMFAKTAVEELDPNVIVVRIQPDEGISLHFGTKVPGPEVRVRTVDMDFDYQTDFPSGTPEAYERLLLDCMAGDGTLFTRADEVEEAWEIIDPVRRRWEGERPASYAPGEWGPAEADDLIARDGRAWRVPT